MCSPHHKRGDIYEYDQSSWYSFILVIGSSLERSLHFCEISVGVGLRLFQSRACNNLIFVTYHIEIQYNRLSYTII